MEKEQNVGDEELMKKLFRLVPPIPKSLEKQLRRNELYSTCYLFTFRSNGERYGYCTECGKTVSLEMKRTETSAERQNRQKKHNEVGFCPECKARVVFKDSGRGKDKLWAYAHFILAQRAGKMLILRFFDVTRSFRNFRADSIGEEFGNGKLAFHEEHRLFLDPENRKAYQFTRQWEYYGNSYYYKHYGREAGDGCPKTDWQKRKRIRTNFINYGFSQIYGIDDELLRKTGFQYCPIDLYDKFAGTYKNYVDFLLKYTRYPDAVEYMMKCGFSKLFCDIQRNGSYHLLNLRAKTPEKLMRLSKQEISQLRKGHYDSCGQMSDAARFKYLQRLSSSGLSEKEKNFFLKEVTLYSFTARWEHILKYTTFTKADNYIKKHAKGSLLPLAEYADYIIGCERLGLDLTRHEVLFPRDLFESHDRVNALIRAQEAQERLRKTEKDRKERLLKEKDIDLKIQKQFKALSKKWGFRSNGLLIRPAENLEEIIIEGEKQNICVGYRDIGYTERHAQGTAFIFFVRRESDPDTPVCTVEITSDGTVVQCRGYSNHAPSEEVQEFMNKFKSYIASISLEKSA